MYKHLEPEGKKELVPKIAAGFGGDIGSCGSVCGSLIGSIMAVGTNYTPNEAGRNKRAELTLNLECHTENSKSGRAVFSVETQ